MTKSRSTTQHGLLLKSKAAWDIPCSHSGFSSRKAQINAKNDFHSHATNASHLITASTRNMASCGSDPPWSLSRSFHSPSLPIAKKIHVNLDPASSFVNPNTTSPESFPSSSSSSDHQRQSLHDAHRIVSNYVVTTQYSLLSFVPKNLYHQFRRVANFFFLMIVILQCIEPFQSLEPAVSALPLIIIVGLTMARDGFEDWKRHEVDQTVNYRETLALSNWRNTTMEEKMRYHHRRSSRQLLSAPGWDQAPSILGRGGAFFAKPVRRILQTMRQRWVSIRRAFTSAPRPSITGGEQHTSQSTIPLPQQLENSTTTTEHPPTIGFRYRYLSRNNSENGLTFGQAGELYQLVHQPPENDYSQPYWRTRLWKDVQEGDYILLRQDDIIPADILILSSSEQEPICYIETKNLDGETNLKIRRCVSGLSDLRSPEECARRQFWVESEGPTNNLLKYNGAVVFPLHPKRLDPSTTQEQEKEQEQELVRVGIDMNHLLLRGCILRNTTWVIGLVVFTGSDTKLQMNAGQVPSKRSDIERKMNFQMQVFQNEDLRFGHFDATQRKTKHYEDYDFIMVYTISVTSDFTLMWHRMSVITFQNLVPVALYLTVEGVKTIQAYFIYQDQELYYEERDIPCMPRSWNLSDDLGQIEYIFSDKTGTLTTNQMEFKKCSIQGHVFDYTAIAPNVEPSVGSEADDVTTEGIAVPCQASNEPPPSKGVMEVLEEEDESTAGHGHNCRDGERLEGCLERNQTLRRSSHHHHHTLGNGESSFAKSTTLSRHTIQIQQQQQQQQHDDHPETDYSTSGDDHQDDSDAISRSRTSSNATVVENDHTPASSQRTSSVLDKSAHRAQQQPSQQTTSQSTRQPAFSLETQGHFRTGASDPSSVTDVSIARDLQRSKDYFFLNLSICHTVLVSATSAVTDSRSDMNHVNSCCCCSSSSSCRQDRTQGYLPTPNDTDYQAQSPDELALVIASRGLGYTFLGRQVDTILMAHPQELEPRRYKVLHVLEFNSTRKRMSVIVQRQLPPRDATSPPPSRADARKNKDADAREDEEDDGDDENEELLLLTKGADNMIFERVAPGQQPLIHETTLHLQDFAREGLRTLCLAYKVLDPVVYHHWAKRYHFASTFVEGTHPHAENHKQHSLLLHDRRSDTTDPVAAFANMHSNNNAPLASSSHIKTDAEPSSSSSFGTKTRQSMLEDLAEEMERDLQLLGATGIEDRLQDGVPETIRLIQRAGIKVWVLTGDKMETAISIGVSTGLLSHCCGGGDGGGGTAFYTMAEAHKKDFVSSQQAKASHPSSATKEEEEEEEESVAKSAEENMMEPSSGWGGGSRCPDMELILIRGDIEPLQSLPKIEDDRIPSSSAKHSVTSSESNDEQQQQQQHHEHPVKTRIKNALKTFTASSSDGRTDSPAVRRGPEMEDTHIADDDEEKSTTKSDQDTRSGFGAFVPWRTRVKVEAPSSTTRSIRNSVSSSSRRRSSTLIGRPMSEEAPPVREGQNTALVIDGQALKYALEEDPECKTLLLELACRCSSVICCRVSPLQKAMVVKMVKDAKKVMTLAIGDGANDVSMIQEAHIGIGVAGEEGLQAVMASDYSIGQFRYLTRLLLVHGHYAYLRNTSMVMLFIYKNILGIGVLFCYEFVCGFSSVPVFEYSYVLLYNVVLTVFPPLIIGIFDRDIGPGVLMTFPELYKVGLLQQEFTNTRFLVYSLEGTFQSIVCFLLPFLAYQQGVVDSSGLVQEMYEMGLAMAVASIMQANIFAAVVSHSFCAFHIIFIWGSVVLIVVYSALYALMPRALSQWNPNYGFTFSVMGSFTFWAVVVLTLLACNLPRLTARFIRRTWWPSDLDILQEVCQKKCADPNTLFVSDAPLAISSFTSSASASTSNQAMNGDSKHKVDNHDDDRGLHTDIVHNGRAYRALSRHWRLDWIWGLMPSSAPTPEQGNNAHAIYQGMSQNGTSSFITSTATSLVEPVPLSHTLRTPIRAGDRQPSADGSSTSLPSAPTRSRGGATSPHNTATTVTSRHHPCCNSSSSSTHSKDHDSVSMRSAESSGGASMKRRPLELSSSSQPTIMLRRQQQQQQQQQQQPLHHRPWREELFSAETGPSDLQPRKSMSQEASVMTSSMTRRRRSTSSFSNRSASPSLPPPSAAGLRSPQIGVSDPLSSRSPTPILGFGFAQEEGMADLILGTRYYNQRDHSPDPPSISRTAEETPRHGFSEQKAS
ncbi:hypothetical protein KVV02_008116, partial [Mortierella alpina]